MPWDLIETSGVGLSATVIHPVAAVDTAYVFWWRVVKENANIYACSMSYTCSTKLVLVQNLTNTLPEHLYYAIVAMHS